MTWDMLGHEWAETLLRKHMTHGDVRHAYLFTGPPGVGRRSLALRFAQALNCPQPTALGEPCRQCRTCTQIEAMQHADLSVVAAESVGGMLKVDTVRELQHSLSLTAYQSPYRVGLLLRFEEANASAQNALLKTLEEAPEKVILLLTADEAENLLPTIVSRCEVLRLRPLGINALEQALVERWNLPVEEARLLAHLSGGRVGAALAHWQEPDLRNKRSEWLQDLIDLLTEPLRARFAYAERFKTTERETIRQGLQVWLSFWRDVLLEASGAQVPLVNLECEAEIHSVAQAVGMQTALRCTSDLQTALARLDNNLNRQMLLEVTLMDLPRLGYP